MTLLTILLALNAVLHAAVIFRFGTDKENVPFLIFIFVYAALAVAVFLAVPYALWAVLILGGFGLIGLTLNFNKPQRDKTLDKAIWALDAVTVAYVVYLLFA